MAERFLYSFFRGIWSTMTKAHTSIMEYNCDYIYDLCSIGMRIRLLRDLKHATQRELGDAVGLSRERISKVEQGRAGLSPEVMMRLAEYFDVPLEYLYFGKTGDSCFRDLLLAIADQLYLLAGILK